MLSFKLIGILLIGTTFFLALIMIGLWGVSRRKEAQRKKDVSKAGHDIETSKLALKAAQLRIGEISTALESIPKGVLALAAEESVQKSLAEIQKTTARFGELLNNVDAAEKAHEQIGHLVAKPFLESVFSSGRKDLVLLTGSALIAMVVNLASSWIWTHHVREPTCQEFCKSNSSTLQIQQPPKIDKPKEEINIQKLARISGSLAQYADFYLYHNKGEEELFSEGRLESEREKLLSLKDRKSYEAYQRNMIALTLASPEPSASLLYFVLAGQIAIRHKWTSDIEVKSLQTEYQALMPKINESSLSSEGKHLLAIAKYPMYLDSSDEEKKAGYLRAIAESLERSKFASRIADILYSVTAQQARVLADTFSRRRQHKGTEVVVFDCANPKGFPGIKPLDRGKEFSKLLESAFGIAVPTHSLRREPLADGPCNLIPTDQCVYANKRGADFCAALAEYLKPYSLRVQKLLESNLSSYLQTSDTDLDDDKLRKPILATLFGSRQVYRKVGVAADKRSDAVVRLGTGWSQHSFTLANKAR